MAPKSKRDRYAHLAHKTLRRNGETVRLPDGYGAQECRRALEVCKELELAPDPADPGFWLAVCRAEGITL